MVRKRKILWDNEAKRSLRSIFDFIKKKESTSVAKKVRDGIIVKTKSLSLFPDKFSLEPYLKQEKGDYRYAVISIR
jgi:plasmid stabilization system protein ParE